jgi:hypothetical protein
MLVQRQLPRLLRVKRRTGWCPVQGGSPGCSSSEGCAADTWTLYVHDVNMSLSLA